MSDYTNAYFNGNGFYTMDPGPTYYSNYIQIKDIYTNNVLDTFYIVKGLEFDSLGMCVTKLTVHGISDQERWRNDCAIYCMYGATMPQSSWQV